jgi:hypothetical protein
MRLAGMGIAAGLLASLALSRVLQPFLYGVTAIDPLIYCGAVALFSTVALIACYIPAPGSEGRCDGGLALRIAHRPGYTDIETGGFNSRLSSGTQAGPLTAVIGR